MSFCGLVVKYPADPRIWIKVRIYNPALLLSIDDGFRGLADHVRKFVECLDITDEVEARKRDGGEVALPDLAGCVARKVS